MSKKKILFNIVVMHQSIKIYVHLLIILAREVVAVTKKEKSLSFQDGPTGSMSFVNIYQNVSLDPNLKKTIFEKLAFLSRRG